MTLATAFLIKLENVVYCITYTFFKDAFSDLLYLEKPSRKLFTFFYYIHYSRDFVICKDLFCFQRLFVLFFSKARFRPIMNDFILLAIFISAIHEFFKCQVPLLV